MSEFCPSWLSSFLSHSSPCSSVELWHKVRNVWSICLTQAVGHSGNHGKLGSHSSSLQATVSTLLQDYASTLQMETPYKGNPGFPGPSSYSHQPSSQPRGLIFPVSGSRMGVSNTFQQLPPQCGFQPVWNSSLPFPESPYRGTHINLTASLLFLPDSLQIFLIALVVQVFLPVSVSFQWKLVHT